MRPIVDGIKKEFSKCLKLERVNFHTESTWKTLLSPIGTPDFVLLDSSKNIIYRWIGLTEKEEFATVMKPLCG